METVSIHQVEAHLADLINRLANEGGFIIAKNRKPLAKLVPISAEDERNASAWASWQVSCAFLKTSIGRAAMGLSAFFAGRRIPDCWA